VADELVKRLVRASVHCRGCGYELRGLQSDARCPECGLDVWPSIVHTVDPHASRLPKRHDPAGVGDALLWLSVSGFAAVLLLSSRAAAELLGRVGFVGADRWLGPWVTIVAGVVAAGGLWSVWKLNPPAGGAPGESDRREVWLLGAGLGGWALLVAVQGVFLQAGWAPAFPVGSLMALAADGAAAVGLLGASGVFRVIGLRSREYRNAHGGRQSVQAMIAAVGGDAAGRLLVLVAEAGSGLGGLRALGTGITKVSDLMLLIGLAYLVVNAAWIRRSLRCPPPTLEEVLGEPGEGEADGLGDSPS